MVYYVVWAWALSIVTRATKKSCATWWTACLGDGVAGGRACAHEGGGVPRPPSVRGGTAGPTLRPGGAAARRRDAAGHRGRRRLRLDGTRFDVADTLAETDTPPWCGQSGARSATGRPRPRRPFSPPWMRRKSAGGRRVLELCALDAGGRGRRRLGVARKPCPNAANRWSSAWTPA